MRREIEDQEIVEEDYIYNEVKDQVGRVVVEGEKPDARADKVNRK